VANIEDGRKALTSCILEADGKASRQERRAAFDGAGASGPRAALIDQVAWRAWEITDDDLASVKAAPTGEDEIFELVVCAAVGEATRQYETALAALDAALAKA
jgi:hypothetical protein